MAQWTHPICRSCYEKRSPDRSPLLMRSADIEICCDCGAETQDGIYIHADAKQLSFPAKDKE